MFLRGYGSVYSLKNRKLVWLAVVIFMTAGLFLFWPRNAGEFSDSDLRFVRSQVNPDQNGYAILETSRSRGINSELKKTQIAKTFAAENWDATNVAAVLDEHREEIEAFDKSQQRPLLQIPEIRKSEDDVSYLGYWKTLAQLSAIKAQQQFHQGQEAQAFSRAMDIVRFGQQIERSEGGLIHYLVGISVKGVGLKTIRDFIGQTSVDSETLLHLSDALSHFHADEKALTNTVKCEYQLQVGMIDDVRSGDLPSAGQSTRFERTIVAIFSRPLLNSTATKREFAKFAREQLAWIPKTWKEIPVNAVTHMTNTAELILSGNAVGELLKGMVLPGQEKFLVRKCHENVDVDATRLFLALRCFERTNGKMPELLQDLAPRFIESIPADSFDGLPIRYSAEKRMIYSVGNDLLDAGGVEYDQKKQRLDIVFKINFPDTK